MQRRQSGAHTRVRTHFVCHTLSPELRSVTLNYSANKTCRPKQRASLPHSLTHTHIHMKCYHFPKESVMVTHYFCVYKCHVTHARITPLRADRRSGFFSCIPLSAFNHSASFNLALWSPFSLGVSLSFPSRVLSLSPFPSRLNKCLRRDNKQKQRPL